MLSHCCNLTILALPFPLSFASLDTRGNGIGESSWLIDYYNNSCRCRGYRADDATNLKEELDEDLVLCVVPFPVDQ